MATTENGNHRPNDNKRDNSDARDLFIYREDVSPGLKYEMQLKRVFVRTASQFQDIDVVETCFGKTLITDGLTQSTEFDEFAYHESLVHPALIKCAQVKPPEIVFIGGGGELATAREVLRHASVKRVVMVDLDEKVVQVCKKYLESWGGDNVYNNPRFELIIGDAHEYILNTQEVFDVIIMDISDPVEAGPGIALYTKEFYEFAVTKLHPGGVIVTQAGMASSVPAVLSEAEAADQPTCFAPILNTLGSVFDVSLGYTTNIPSFGSDWGFVMAYNTNTPQESNQEWSAPATEMIDALLDQQLGTDQAAALKHYDGLTHCRMFALPKPLRTYLSTEKRIMTKDNPIYMYSG
eukprot:CAMPEP_0172450526 /NCGR_PEP_ID=MMETSP1065-20121228/8828_1 /TAXON_ID=265537 /ORGANISM="Amphiprora paludosa, Strain CCMP125" /LENGTH=349 /DNA_ID=CAMNT_0013202315 /DNA_START=167 /DNA_END=1216 /DNA_ORIENTATION=+